MATPEPHTRRRCAKALAAVLAVLAAMHASACATGSAHDRAAHERAARDRPAHHLALSRSSTRTTRALPPARRHSSDTLPGGITCLLKLRAIGVAHRELPAVEHVDTPIEITGAIGGVKLVRTGRLRALCDCRLALALARAAPLLRGLGVEELHFSNAYSKRAIRRGKISRHRMGLAIDVHRVRVSGALLRVKRDYQRGERGPCGARAGALNRLACELEARSLFAYVLTPDSNAAHHDHFHLSILSLDRRRRLSRQRPYPIVTD